MEFLKAPQLAEWEAFNSLEPVGEYRQDYRFAQLCCLIVDIAQSAFGSKGKRKRFSISDFMPWGPETKKVVKKQSVEEMKQIFQTIARVKGAPKRKPK